MSQKFCYALLPSQLADPSAKDVDVIVIKAGETGYYPTDWKWQKEFAEQARDEMNARLGLSPLEADQMLVASMFPHKK